MLCVFAETHRRLGQDRRQNGSDQKPGDPAGRPRVLNGNLPGRLDFLGATDGNTLIKAPQPVPGGLLGVTAPTWWPNSSRICSTKPSTRLHRRDRHGGTGRVRPRAIKLDLQRPVHRIRRPRLHMPVKIKLGNPFLGSSCYIGSNSSPIMLETHDRHNLAAAAEQTDHR